MEDENAQKL